jgi:hypothetical protein
VRISDFLECISDSQEAVEISPSSISSRLWHQDKNDAGRDADKQQD